jgi:hypothetical protein
LDIPWILKHKTLNKMYRFKKSFVKNDWPDKIIFHELLFLARMEFDVLWIVELVIEED